MSDLWQKAAVLGSLWAASEIVLGSFLHNLRIPLSGHFLTAIAVIVLVAGHRTWPLPGLLLRAGLVAALMKSASPSAVLLGPMVAIAMEGILMEVGVRLVRGGIWGYVLGGALAMSWTLVHKFGSLLLTYGPDLVRVYGDLIAVAERQLGPIPLGPWGPLVALGVVNLAFGTAAALAGSRIGAHRERDSRFEALAELPREWLRRKGGVPGSGTRPWLPFLAFWLAALPLGLGAFTRLPLLGKALIGGTAVLIATMRYGRALRRLGRPGFWISLLVVTMLAGAVTGALSHEEGMGWVPGLSLGLGMSLHAVFVTMCFAALSTELTHPLLKRWFQKAGGGQLHRAIHAAFATLPLVVAALPSGRDLVRSPLRALEGLLPRMNGWLRAVQRPLNVIGVVAGESGRGKTTLVSKIVDDLRGEGLQVGGILTPGEMKGGRRWSFRLVDLATGESLPMGTREQDSPWPPLGAFRVNPAALEMGRKALSPEAVVEYDLLVVDEVGPWELAGEGWISALEALYGSEVPVLLVSRSNLVEDVVARLAPGGAPVWEVGVLDDHAVIGAIRGVLESCFQV